MWALLFRAVSSVCSELLVCCLLLLLGRLCSSGTLGLLTHLQTWFLLLAHATWPVMPNARTQLLSVNTPQSPSLLQVEVLDAASKEPLLFFMNLAIPPAVQLALTGVQQALPQASLAPPSLPGMGTAAGMGAGSAAAAAAAAGVAAVRLDGGADGAADGPDAAAAGGGVIGSLTVAQAGGLTAVNLFGNSRVDIGAQDSIQQQAERSEQQQQRQVSVVVEPRPVGGNQGHPCRMLHLVLLLQDKMTFERG